MNARLRVIAILLGLIATRLRALSRRTKRQPLPAWNSMFRRDLLPSLENEKQELAAFDLYLYDSLNNPRLLGQIVYEYGMLLNYIPQWGGLKVLDIGTGRSTLPNWMSSKGASVVCFEYPKQLEGTILGRFGKLNRMATRPAPRKPVMASGTMLELPFADNSFDLVTSFSVIEHLDTNLPDLSYVPYEIQKQRAAQVLNEMVRVTRPGGHIYITSDCCDYATVKTDAWRSAYYYKEGPDFSGAWPVQEVPALFYDYLQARGCRLAGSNTFRPEDLNGNENFNSFRGPAYSAFAVLAIKN